MKVFMLLLHLKYTNLMEMYERKMTNLIKYFFYVILILILTLIFLNGKDTGCSLFIPVLVFNNQLL